jgi:hypothetical protein
MLLSVLAFWGYCVDATRQFGIVYRRVINAINNTEQPAYRLLSDGQVISADTELPDAVRNDSYVYNESALQLVGENLPPNTRFRPLHIIALSVTTEATHTTHDLSEWIGELRISPVKNLHPTHLIRLWAFAHSVYLPLRGYSYFVTLNDGSETTEIV